jgi:uncharacterized membrane protein (DUF373 family)
MVFMFTTTLTASWQLIGIFQAKASKALTQAEALTFKIDAFLVMLMAGLAIIVLTDLFLKLYRYLNGAESEKIVNNPG